MVVSSISCSYWTYKSSYATGAPRCSRAGIIYRLYFVEPTQGSGEYPNNWVVRVDPAMALGFITYPKRPTFKGHDILEPELLEAIELW